MCVCVSVDRRVCGDVQRWDDRRENWKREEQLMADQDSDATI